MQSIVAKTDDISLSRLGILASFTYNIMLVRTSGLEVILVGRQRIRLAVICTRALLGNMQLVIGHKVSLG